MDQKNKDKISFIKSCRLSNLSKRLYIGTDMRIEVKGNRAYKSIVFSIENYFNSPWHDLCTKLKGSKRTILTFMTKSIFLKISLFLDIVGNLRMFGYFTTLIQVLTWVHVIIDNDIENKLSFSSNDMFITQ